MKILVLNTGSSSVKFQVLDTNTQACLASGLIENIGSENGRLRAKHGDEKIERDFGQIDHKFALDAADKVLNEIGVAKGGYDGIGHRIVSGGEKFTESMLVTDDVVKGIEDCIELAPLHNPSHLVGIREALRLFPTTPQVVVFDTAFHQTMPEHAYMYAVPRKLYDEAHLRRYGAHGTSHRFVSAKTAEMLGRPLSEIAIVTAHLGNGCSCAAVVDGKCMDTTMGLTPLEGLIMGTRSGDIDPSVYSFLNKRYGWDISRINNMLNKDSGLLGISGLSNDMRTLVNASESGHEGAKLAIEMFAYRLAKLIAGMVVALGRKPDAIVFTGGIGENSIPPRMLTIKHLAGLGYKIDDAKNKIHGSATGGVITADDSPIAMIVPTNEELLIALDTEKVINSKK